MKKLVIGAMFAALVASPAFAQSYGPMHPAEPPTSHSAPYHSYGPDVRNGRTPSRADPYSAYGAVTPFGSPGVDGGGANGMSRARESAIRACSAEGGRFSQHTWGSMGNHQYRSCMAQHGQPE